jgi:2-methylthioadenine synthetase
VSAKRIAKKVGKTLKVLVDEINADGGIGRTRRTRRDRRRVYIAPATKASKRYKVGDFVSVKITGADGHDLWGEV